MPGDDQIKTARLIAQGEIEATGAQLLAPRNEDEAPHRLEAEEFLWTVLADGPLSAKQVVEQAREAQIAEKTLRRAKSKLGVKAVQVSGKAHGGWAWELPNQGGHLTHDRGHLTTVKPNPHISDDGHLTGEGDHLRVRWSGGHADEGDRPPPRPQQIWLYPDAPDRRFRVLEVLGDQVKTRIESSNGDAGRLLEFPTAVFGDGLRRVA